MTFRAAQGSPLDAKATPMDEPLTDDESRYWLVDTSDGTRRPLTADECEALGLRPGGF